MGASTCVYEVQMEVLVQSVKMLLFSFSHKEFAHVFSNNIAPVKQYQKIDITQGYKIHNVNNWQIHTGTEPTNLIRLVS